MSGGMSMLAPRGEDEWKMRGPLVFYVVVLLGSIVAYSSSVGLSRFLTAFSVLLATAAASSTVGALLGFIFGLPRRAGEQGTEEASGEPGGMGEGTRGVRASQDVSAFGGRYVANTSLGQVSDWLTKILIGAGLVQLADLPQALRAASDFVAQALPGTGAAAFAAGIIVFGLTSGFILCFLWTSLSGRELYESSEEKIATVLQFRVRRLGGVGLEGAEDFFQRTASEQLPKSDIREVEEVAAAVKSFTDKYRTEPLAASDYRRLARQLRAAGHFQEAYDMYLHAYEVDRTDPAPLNFAGAIASSRLGKYEEAERLYLKALQIDSDYTSARYNRACNASRKLDRDTALDELEKVIERDPGRYKSLARRDAEPNGPFAWLKEDTRFLALTNGKGGGDQAATGGDKRPAEQPVSSD
jgi:tetratricopeptide (TPR) repeat protein